MSFKKEHLKDLIERVLKEVNLYSEAAVSILMDTCAQESKFGTYLKQLGLPAGKGGMGAWQIERITFEDLKARFGKKFPVIQSFTYDQMEYDLRAQIIMARIKYYSCPGLIPKDLEGQWLYYKKYYNTFLGAATREEYMYNHGKYVA